jgi:phytoene dehydrogenase-like protein
MIDTVEAFRAGVQGVGDRAHSDESARPGAHFRSRRRRYHARRLSLDQLFSARPVLGHADYRSPVAGLYMCGSGTHPGGGVSGMPGHNAAHAVMRDMRRL